MTKHNFSVFFLLASGLVFVVMTITAALNIASTPATVQIVAPMQPVLPTTESALAGSSNGGSSVATGEVDRALLQTAQDSNQSPETRNQAVLSIAALPGGDIEKGKLAFNQHCIACHKIHGQGADFAPELTDVASRLGRDKIIESILNPSAVVEEKYKTTLILTLDGESMTGLLLSKENGLIQLFDGKVTHEIAEDDVDEMVTKSMSSMPEKLAEAMGPKDFLGLVEYLSGLKKTE